MRTITKILRISVTALNLIAAAAYLLSAYSPYISPVEHKYLACLGLAFPIIALVNAAFVFVWVALRPVYALLPILTLLLGWGSLTTYFSLGHERKAEGNTLTLLTYNTQGQAMNHSIKDLKDNPVLNYVISSGADIVCLQEVNSTNRWLKKKVDKYMAEHYPYRDYTTFRSGNGVACFSRYPILSSESIDYESESNGSVLYRIGLDADTLVLVNNHLESNRLNDEDKDDYRHILNRSTSRDSIEAAGKNLLHKLAAASRLRAPQADSVALALERNRSRLMIALGDFNDSPVSYARRVISQSMDDAFAKGGFGIGATYHDSRMYVRIDHVLVSKAFTVAECYVDKSIDASDHYPLRVTLCH